MLTRATCELPTGISSVRSPTQLQVLLFDQDQEGRQRIQTILQREAPTVKITSRASEAAFLRALTKRQFDAVILGSALSSYALPHLLNAFSGVTARQPLLFVVGDAPSAGDGLELDHFAKDDAGLAHLAQELPPSIRAAQIGSIGLGLDRGLAHIDSENMRTSIAERAIQALDKLSILSMYISIDPRRGRWVIRASTYPEDAIRLIETLVEKGGQVAPLVHEAPPDFQQILQGTVQLETVDLKSLLNIIMPWLDEVELARLQNALDLETVSLVPVQEGAEMHGILAVGGSLSRHEREAIKSFATHFARSLSAATKTDERNTRARALQTLQQVLVSVSSNINADQLNQKVLDLLAEVVAYDSARIYLKEEDHLHLVASKGAAAGLSTDTWEFNHFDGVGSNFLRTLVEGKSSLFTALQDHDKPGEPGSEADWRSWMAVPIRWRGQTTGVLTLAKKVEGFFRPLHLDIAETVAQQLGVALENARLFEHSNLRAEKLKIVHEIGRSSVSLLDSQLLVFEAAQRVIEIFEYDQVGIFMVEEDVLISEIFLHGKALKERKDIGEITLNSGSIFDEAVKMNMPILMQELDDSAGLAVIPGTGKARAAMLIPLAIKGAVVGVMLVLSHSRDGIDEDDVEILQVLAAQLGISLVNARLFSEVRAHAAKLEQRVEERTNELQSQKERTEAILRSVADAVMVLDLEGRLILANPMAQSLLSRAWSEQLYQRVVALQQDTTQDQASWEFGSESFEALSSNVDLDGQIIGTVIVLRDITRLKELDRLKSQFVATVSHELRTPLANIKLYLSLLRRSQVDGDSHYYKTLDSETQRLTTMIEDLLDLSRLDSEQKIAFHPLDLRTLLEEIIETQRPMCVEKRIDLTYDLEGTPRILGNHDRLIQVFTNLFANALAYTPAGNSIAISLRPSMEGEPAKGVVVIVDDTGMGIPAEEIPYVFDRFYRGTMAQQLKIHGSGLGLAIVREIVESHGGTITVQSGIGRGTSFRLWFPLAGSGEDNNG